MNDIDIDKQLVLICSVMKTYTVYWDNNKVLQKILRHRAKRYNENRTRKSWKIKRKPSAIAKSFLDLQCTVSCCESQFVIKHNASKEKTEEQKRREKCNTFTTAIQLYRTQCQNVTFNSIIFIAHSVKSRFYCASLWLCALRISCTHILSSVQRDQLLMPDLK